MGEPVTGPYYKIFECVVGMQLWQILCGLRPGCGRSGDGGKFYCYKVPCEVLGGLGKGGQAVVLKKVCFGIIGTADFEDASFKLQYEKVIEPVSAVDRVK
jgi:hypothetical protein